MTFIAFDASDSHQGIVVCFKTDKNVYFNYYNDLYSQSYSFSEEEFRKAASTYYEYISSFENNYNERGEALGQGCDCFLSFSLDKLSVKNKTPNYFLLRCIVLVFAVAAVATVVFV